MPKGVIIPKWIKGARWIPDSQREWYKKAYIKVYNALKVINIPKTIIDTYALYVFTKGIGTVKLEKMKQSEVRELFWIDVNESLDYRRSK